MADVARATQDESLLKACETLWNNMVHQKMYVTGGIGATHIGEAFSSTMTCQTIPLTQRPVHPSVLWFFARRMLEIQAKAEYADVMELALYNGVLSGMALDGKSFYCQSAGGDCRRHVRKDERKFHVKPIRQEMVRLCLLPSEPGKNGKLSCILRIHGNDTTLFVHSVPGWRQWKEKK